jgi:hypothetical protein
MMDMDRNEAREEITADSMREWNLRRVLRV